MHNEILTIGKFTIYGYGLMIGIGFLTAVLVAMYRAKKQGLKQEAILDIAIYCLISGILGGKLLYVIVEWERFIKDPWAILGSSGFVVYGGIVLGVAVGVTYLKIKKQPVNPYFDLVMPEIAIAQGIGRIGCFLAGCCYGAPTDGAWGVVFPEGSLAPAGIKLIPTQLIMSAGDLLIAAILILFSQKNKVAGNVGAMYLVLYGAGRFCIEFLRNDSRGAVGALSTSQFISIFIVVIGIGLMVFNILKAKKQPTDPNEKVKQQEEA